MNLEGFIKKRNKNFRNLFLTGLLASSLTISSCNPITTHKFLPEYTQNEQGVKTEISDISGQVSFIDNSTQEEVTLNIIDKDNYSPISDVRTTYWDGEGFEIFLIDDPSLEYLPSMGIYSHNSTHVIKTGKFGDGIYEIATIGEEDPLSQVIWTWKSENKMNFSTYSYERTVDLDEAIQIKNRQAAVVDIIWKGIEKFFGISLPKDPSEIIDSIAPFEENPPKRWDIYTYRDGYNSTSFFKMIPSNIPTVEITNFYTKEDGTRIWWEGSDKDTYERLTFLPSNQDITKYLDGNSTSDLMYSHRVEGFYDWTNWRFVNSTRFKITDMGEYTFELRVKDEAGNIGTASRDFMIGSSPPSREKIVFSSIRNNNANIYSINVEGINEESLANTFEWEVNPGVSPNGSKIVFSSGAPSSNDNYDIYLMNIDGSNKTQLTNNIKDELYPVFSPNGNKIAYTASYSSGYENIYVMNLDGGNNIKVTNSNAGDWDLAWYPGDKIAFSSKRDGNREIYTINPDGSGLERLTYNSTYDRFPSWSPDKNKIAFSSNRTGDYEIWIMDADGTNPKNISKNPNKSDKNPYWSPDSNQIVYDSNEEIWIMDADGSNKTQVTNNNYDDESPVWISAP